MRATFDPYSGAPQLLFAFEAAVIGGAGSLWGTLAGGIVLALAQTLGAQLHPLGFLIGGHVAFVVVLFVRLFVAGRGRRLRALLEEGRHERASAQTMTVERWTPASRTAVAGVADRHRAASPSRRCSSARAWSTG